MTPTARRHAREYALQAIYQWQLSETPAHEIEADFLTHQIRQKTDRAYFSEILNAVIKDPVSLDAEIEPFLDRKITDLDPIELAILRISTYELAKRPDVPWRVVINEALELTKKFGSIEGYKFVNGVLDRIARKLRANEIKS